MYPAPTPNKSRLMRIAHRSIPRGASWSAAVSAALESVGPLKFRTPRFAFYTRYILHSALPSSPHKKISRFITIYLD